MPTNPTDIGTITDAVTVIPTAWAQGINDWVYNTYTVMGSTYTATAFTTALLPSQATNSGKSLVTNATVASWGYPDQLSTASGSAPSYGLRAWGNFVGASGATNAAGNATCVRNSTGDYTVSFTVAMADANYAEAISFGTTGTTAGTYVIVSRAAGSIRFQCYNSSLVLFDPTTVCIQIAR